MACLFGRNYFDGLFDRDLSGKLTRLCKPDSDTYDKNGCGKTKF